MTEVLVETKIIIILCLFLWKRVKLFYIQTESEDDQSVKKRIQGFAVGTVHP